MRSRLPLPSRLRRVRDRLRAPDSRVRGVLGVLVLGLLAVPLIAASSDVDVVVDGESLETRTYAATVDDVLDELEVEVAPADEVVPAPDTPVEDGLHITVARAITVEVRVDGELAETVHAPVRSVAAALAAADLAHVRDEGARIRPGWSARVEDGDVVHVERPTEVGLTVDGETRELRTYAGTVGQLLQRQGVELGEHDEVTPAPDAPLADGQQVVVERVAFREVVEEVTLEREVVRRETDELEQGTTRVQDAGHDGLRRDVYRVELVDGEEVGRELVEQEVVTEPHDRVVLVGTRQPAPAAPSGSVWDRLAQCESGGNWSHRGGTYHGGLQFHPGTWRRHKPAGYPEYAYQATREQQIVVGERVQASQGWAAWPRCSREIGLR